MHAAAEFQFEMLIPVVCNTFILIPITKANLTSTLITQLRLDSTNSYGDGGLEGAGLDAKTSGLPVHGAFVDSCTRHCTGGGPVWKPGTIGEVVDSMSPLQALSHWYRGGDGGGGGGAGGADPSTVSRSGVGRQGRIAAGVGIAAANNQDRRLLWRQAKPFPCVSCCGNSIVENNTGTRYINLI